jgi:hypothetical protein
MKNNGRSWEDTERSMGNRGNSRKRLEIRERYREI